MPEGHDAIIHLNGRELLDHAGKISHEMATEKSNIEFQKYRESQKLLEREKNLKELEADIGKLKKHLPKIRKRKSKDA